MRILFGLARVANGMSSACGDWYGTASFIWRTKLYVIAIAERRRSQPRCKLPKITYADKTTCAEIWSIDPFTHYLSDDFDRVVIHWLAFCPGELETRRIPECLPKA